jgi:quercetin dioxygenase-like cupin family protein
MELKRSGSPLAGKGPAEYFTGTAWIDQLVDTAEPSRLLAGSVAFEPGARTKWHSHSLGQILFVTAGRGWMQCWGGPIEVILPGDVVCCPPGEKHWHGATATTAMTYFTVVEKLNGKAVDWMEEVSEEQYLAGPRAS